MRAIRLLALAALPFALNCGGGSGSSSPAPGPGSTATTATTFSYTAPTVPAGAWSIQQDALSADTITFKVVGPSTATSVRGYSFTVKVDPALASWAPVNGDWAQEAGILNLGDVSVASDPKLKIASNREAKLVFGAFQKDETLPAVAVDGKTLYRFALKLKAGVAPGAVKFAVEKANVLPQDLSTLQRPYTPSLPAVAVAVGTLAAK